jgi:hypothetical protein
MLKLLDVTLGVFFWLVLAGLSLASLLRLLQGKPMGYGQLPALPESWRRWILDEHATPTRKNG